MMKDLCGVGVMYLLGFLILAIFVVAGAIQLGTDLGKHKLVKKAKVWNTLTHQYENRTYE